MPCSAVTLSLATISAILSVALLAIAFSTDNWLSYEVNRNSIMVSCSRKENPDPVVDGGFKKIANAYRKRMCVGKQVSSSPVPPLPPPPPPPSACVYIARPLP